MCIKFVQADMSTCNLQREWCKHWTMFCI